MSKEIYAPVGGVAQKVIKMYAPVNGVAHSVKKAYIGVNGVARQFFSMLPPLDPVFANNTWEDVIAACQLGRVPDTWAVGDQMPMTINGTDYLVDIIGKNHDTYADGSGKAPLTFQLHNCYVAMRVMFSGNTNKGGWRDSHMRNTHLPNILALMPSAVRAGIREVSKKTTTGEQSNSVVTTADKLFLLSELEVFGEIWYSFPGEGTQYAYYAQGNPLDKKIYGASVSCWERSPYTDSDTSFCVVSGYGEMSFDIASTSLYFAPAFCF